MKELAARLGGWQGSSSSFAIQGELCGHSILQNSMGFKKGQHHFYVFGIYDIDKQRWLPPIKMIQVCKTLKLDHAPVVAQGKLQDLATDVDGILRMAEGKGVLGEDREGLIFRALDCSFSFKAIANSWLLKYGQYKTSPGQW